MAGAAARARRCSADPVVGDPGRRGCVRGRHRPTHRSSRGRRPLGHSAGTSRARVPHHQPPRDHRGPPGEEPGADLHRPLHPGRRRRAGPVAAEPQAHEPRGEGRHRRRHRGLPVHRRVRSDVVEVRPPGHRRAPCGHAPEVPPSRRATGSGRPAEGDLRHGHAGRRDQRADQDRAVHVVVQVRRHPHPALDRPGVPPDRRASRTGGLRHERDGGRAGPRARHPERQDGREGRR